MRSSTIFNVNCFAEDVPRFLKTARTNYESVMSLVAVVNNLNRNLNRSLSDELQTDCGKSPIAKPYWRKCG